MNLDACMHCGRCLEYCPTFNTDKPLRPRDLILEIGGYMADSGGIFSGELGEGQNSARFRWGEGPERELIGGVVSTEELWDCTTCGACMEQCPVLIEHVPLIVGMRRNLVLEQSEFPDELTNVFNNLERLSSPYQFPPNQRDAWTKKMAQPVRIMAEAAAAEEDVEVLFFVGCLGSFDSRNQRTTMALARILPDGGDQLRHPRQGGDLHRRPGPPHRQRISRADDGACRRSRRSISIRSRRSSPPARTASTRSRTSTRRSAATTRSSTTAN